MPSYWRRLGDYYASTIPIVNAPPAANSLWALAGAGSTAYFIITGFLGSYLITRLYLAGAIQRADGNEVEKVKRLSNLTTVELEALEAAPLLYDDTRSDFDSQAKKAAEKILKLSLDQLRDWRDLRVWAKAQLGTGNIQKAIDGYIRCIETMPDDPEVRLGYAIALGALDGAPSGVPLSSSQRSLVQTQLEKARECLRLNSPGPLRKNIYKSLIYSALFLKAPESFRKAFGYAREYYSQPRANDSAGILFNIACAFGQVHAWLDKDRTRRLTLSELEYKRLTQDDSLIENEKAREIAKDSAFDCLELAIERSPDLRDKLAQMLTRPPAGSGVDEDNDFETLAEVLKKLVEPPK
jgi:tetratricopeptide (TPR) repeat protein